PTTIPDEVLNAMHQRATDIYVGPFVEITASLLDDFRTIFGTKGRTYIYAANGHGAWEAALTNALNRGDKVLLLESGVFANSWGETAAMLGVECDRIPGDLRRAVDPAEVEARLRADTEGTIKAVLVVQIDTASSVVNDIEAIRQAMDAAGHGALLMVDTIASLATMPFKMDAWGVDVAVSGSQKGLMTPPGLSFVAAGNRAMAAHETANLRTRYWDWTAREGEEHYHKYCGTPPEHLLFGLRKAVDMILEEGLDNVFLRHQLLAGAVRRCVAVWSQGGAMDFNIIDPAQRGDSVTTILLNNDLEPGPLVRFCDEKCGVIVGSGIGPMTGKALRIAHMGHINAPMILGTLGTIEVGLAALGIPHGKGGVQAAIKYLGAKLAD
ncbi:MAG: aminotransferase class V-fold PLP-dependent enzyme, partial [Alphaproteobacteria bacterium]